MSKRILIVEDEPLISDDLEIIISNLGYEVADKVDSLDSAIAALRKLKIDLALLDVQLKGEKNGIDIAKHINQHYHIPFVFITSFYDDDTLFHIRATDPSGYIVKPFKDADLKANLSLAFGKMQERAAPPLITDLSLFVRHHNEMVKIEYQNIDWIKGEDNYSDIYFNNGDKSTVSQTLKSIGEKFIPHGFIRIHKSYVINISKISSITGNNIFIGDTMLPIGKSYKKQFLERLTIV